jgi:hypothetical protein
MGAVQDNWRSLYPTDNTLREAALIELYRLEISRERDTDARTTVGASGKFLARQITVRARND